MSDLTIIDDNAGRPSKLSKQLITALEDIAQDDSSVILTDEELVEVINSKLPEEDRISYSTFRNYKRGQYQYDREGEELKLQAFLTSLKRIRIKQKVQTSQAMLKEGAGSWQKYAWILERKFNDLNLTHKVDHTTGGESFNKVVIDDSYMKEVEEAQVIDEDDA